MKWASKCNLGDEATLKKYWEEVRPYYFMRSLYPVFPESTLCREMFKVYIRFTMCLYCADDKMELHSQEEARKTCDAFARVDERSRETFPSFPTVDEIMQIVKTFNSPNIVAPTTTYAELVNRISSVLLLHGNVSRDVVYDFRLRLSNAVSIYMQALVAEKQPREKETEMDTLWRRVFGGCIIPYPMFAEIASGAVGKTKQHLRVLNELYILCTLYWTTINDLYSYYYEKDTNCDNVVKAILLRKEAAEMPDAVAKVTQILDAVCASMYEKMEQLKLRYPDDQELHSLLDYIGQATLGAFYLHDYTTPRYQDSPWKVTLVELEKEKLSEWLSEKREYGENVVKNYLRLATDRMANGILDGLCGAFPIHGKFFN